MIGERGNDRGSRMTRGQPPHHKIRQRQKNKQKSDGAVDGMRSGFYGIDS